MPIFDNSPETFQRLDWDILQKGWASLYFKQAVLDEDIRWFNNNNFHVVEFDCKSWSDISSMHRNFKEALNFPDYYGNNLNALNDCLSDIEIVDAGLIIVFRRFDNIEMDLARSLVDIFAVNSRLHLLFGKKLITLIQVNNAGYRIEEGEVNFVSWNRKEFLGSSRGIGSN
jgi:RNAse (barnase) inhibitor barstar